MEMAPILASYHANPSYPSPDMPRITITVPDQTAQPYRFSLERQIVHFGRGDDNDVHIESGSVSSEHCVMERQIGRYVLKDLNSTNGIKLDGERTDAITLRNGQNIHIGDVEFTFELNDEEITALQLEDPTSQLPPLDEPPVQKSSAPTAPEINLKDEPKPEPKPEPQPLPDPEPEIRQVEDKPQPEPLPDIKQVAEPQPQPQHQAPAPPSAPVDNSGFNKLVTMLAALAFLLGVAMHFQRSTGESILTAIMHKMGGGEAAE